MSEKARGSAGSRLTVKVPALTPIGDGHRFVFYGDSCSGVPGAPHEATFARTNSVISALDPSPEFVVFAGDELAGLTADDDELRAQWRHWLDVEMAWLDREQVPLYQVTSNHVTYDVMSERVFTEVLSWLPRNGPEGQGGLSYFVRRGDLLMVFVNTCWSGHGGEGHVESQWLDETLDKHADARFKLVVGHHPAFAVNGFSGEYQRQLGVDSALRLWATLVKHNVLAYLCSHVLAFDVQVHDGVLQILSAGAGTEHRMPEGVEYLHFVQGVLDDQGLRYQVIDHDGRVRERLCWPPTLLPSREWDLFQTGESVSRLLGARSDSSDRFVVWRVSGRSSTDSDGRAQTFLAGSSREDALASLWIGHTGDARRLTVTVAPEPGRSPHYWFGPSIEASTSFDLQIALHSGMGPGGVLWRRDDDSPWCSLTSASPWGPERLRWPRVWTVGHNNRGPDDAAFRGEHLSVRWRSSQEGDVRSWHVAGSAGPDPDVG